MTDKERTNTNVAIITHELDGRSQMTIRRAGLRGRSVLVKMAHGEDATRLEQLELEMDAVRRLRGEPGVPRLLAWGTTEQQALVAIFEYLDYPNLENLMVLGGIRPQQVLLVVAEVLGVLARTGPHLELRPGQILVDMNGRVFLVDLGTPPPSDGRTFGVPGWAHPAWEAGNAEDRATDLWALAMTILRAYTGYLPTRNDSMREQAMDKLPPPVRALLRSMMANPKDPLDYLALKHTVTELSSAEEATWGAQKDIRPAWKRVPELRLELATMHWEPTMEAQAPDSQKGEDIRAGRADTTRKDGLRLHGGMVNGVVPLVRVVRGRTPAASPAPVHATPTPSGDTKPGASATMRNPNGVPTATANVHVRLVQPVEKPPAHRASTTQPGLHIMAAAALVLMLTGAGTMRSAHRLMVLLPKTIQANSYTLGRLGATAAAMVWTVPAHSQTIRIPSKRRDTPASAKLPPSTPDLPEENGPRPVPPDPGPSPTPPQKPKDTKPTVRKIPFHTEPQGSATPQQPAEAVETTQDEPGQGVEAVGPTARQHAWGPMAGWFKVTLDPGCGHRLLETSNQLVLFERENRMLRASGNQLTGEIVIGDGMEIKITPRPGTACKTCRVCIAAEVSGAESQGLLYNCKSCPNSFIEEP